MTMDTMDANVVLLTLHDSLKDKNMASRISPFQANFCPLLETSRSGYIFIF
jgi:hypothetical protein